MRKGRNVTVVVLLLLAAFGLTACGKSKEDYFAERMEAMGGSLELSDENENSQQMKDLMDGLAEDFSNQEVESENEKKTGKKEVSFGVWEGKVYTNKYLGLTGEFDSDWFIYSAAELQQMTGATMDELADSKIGDYVKTMDVVKDMMVENERDLTSINITYTKMTRQEQENYAKKTEKKIVQETVDSIGVLGDAYEQMGMTIKAASAKELYFLGEKRTAQYMYMDYMGTPYYVLQIYDYQIGEYATVITVASFKQDKTLELLDLFTKYE